MCAADRHTRGTRQAGARGSAGPGACVVRGWGLVLPDTVAEDADRFTLECEIATGVHQ